MSVRHYSSTRIDGREVPVPDGAAFPLVCSVQPVMGEVVDELPEAARRRAQLIMIVEDDPDLRITDQLLERMPDRVTRGNGRVYEIDAILDWSADVEGEPHKVATLIEVGDDEASP